MIVETAAPRTLAAVRRRIPRTAIGVHWGRALDQVWDFLGTHPELHEGGHNFFLYRPLGGSILDVAFGVEVARGFQPNGEVEPILTPTGEAATLVHVGAYADLGATHARVIAEIAALGREAAGPFWEIYGDWDENPARLETTVAYLLLS